MHPENVSRIDPGSLKGLPPVRPPSGQFIAQRFLVPLALVMGILLVVVGIIWLFNDVLGFGSPRTPAQFLDKLDRANPDVRWRAAADLSQTLPRDDQLAANPRFALDLAERLKKALDDIAPGEKKLAELLSTHPHLAERLSKRIQNEPDKDRDPSDPKWKQLEEQWKAIEPDLNYALFLSACLGNFALPAGAPLLTEQALKEPAEVSVAVTQQRRLAVVALAKLGDNLKRFDKFPPDRQAAVLSQLEEEVKTASGNRRSWAQESLDYLQERQAGRVQTLGVDAALARCAQDTQDPFLRELAGFAMGFWEGTPEENRRMDRALLRLTSDPGTGDETLGRLLLPTDAKKRDSVPFTTKPGSLIHYNATVALAKRGADGDYLGLLEEMLDEDEQRKNHRLRRPDGRDDPDEATAYLTVDTALKALAALHARRPERVAERPSLRSAVEKLTQSQNLVIQAEAERTRLALGKDQ